MKASLLFDSKVSVLSFFRCNLQKKSISDEQPAASHLWTSIKAYANLGARILFVDI